MNVKDNNDYRTDAENLLEELIAAEKTYGTLMTSDVYPHMQPYFKQQHFKRSKFSAILKDELFTLSGQQGEQPTRIRKPIFVSLETLIFEKSMTVLEVDALLVQLEQALIVRYQEVLLHNDLPNTTAAILQARAEELNYLLQDLQTDLRIKTRTKGKHKEQIAIRADNSAMSTEKISI